MPPRKRTPSGRPKKPTPFELPETESMTLTGSETADPDPESPPEETPTSPEENLSAEPKVLESDDVSLPGQENDGLDVNCMEAEGFNSGGGGGGGDKSEIVDKENDGLDVNCMEIEGLNSGGGGGDKSENVDNGGSQLEIISVAEQNSTEEENAAAEINVSEAHDDNLVANEGHRGEREGEDNEGDDEDNGDSEEDNVDNGDAEDPDMLIPDPLTERNKHKDLQIYVGKLDKGTVEDDLINVFGKFGEIKDARIVRNPTTNKSKGFGFIRYVTLEQAKNALTELKDGIEVNGKHVRISASQDNDTLYVGNICKTWKREHVLETLKSYGIEHIEDLRLPDDPKNEGRIKGFAFLEFNTHSDAIAAFHRLRKPDAVFGRDISAKVAFARTPTHPNEEVLSQVKTVHVEGLTNDWNEDKVKEICKQYGEVMEVKLFRNLGTKRKNFGFITFASRGSALACVEGISDSQIGEDVKVKTSMAKTHVGGQLQKQGFRGGFKVKEKSELSSPKTESDRAKQAGSSMMTGNAKSNQAKRKRKATAEEKGKSLSELKMAKVDKPNKPQSITEGQSVGALSKMEKSNHKGKNLPSKVRGKSNKPQGITEARSVEAPYNMKNTNVKRKNISSKVKNHGNGSIEHGHSRRTSKKLRGNERGTQSDNFKKPKRDHQIGKRPGYTAVSAAYRIPYGPEYTASTGYYQGQPYSAGSASKRHYSDMEPHAGYLEPVAGKRGGPYPGYSAPVVGTQDRTHPKYFESAGGRQYQPHTVYLEASVQAQGQRQARYFEPTVQTHSQNYVRYLEPSVITQSQPPAGYLQPAVGVHGHHLYDSGLRRAVGHDGQGSRGSALEGVGSAVPPDYAYPSYRSYPGYQGGATVGVYDQSRGAFLTRQTYH